MTPPHIFACKQHLSQHFHCCTTPRHLARTGHTECRPRLKQFSFNLLKPGLHSTHDLECPHQHSTHSVDCSLSGTCSCLRNPWCSPRVVHTWETMDAARTPHPPWVPKAGGQAVPRIARPPGSSPAPPPRCRSRPGSGRHTCGSLAEKETKRRTKLL